MAEPQTYNHQDMQRYLQHNMSPQEMHDFEKALMDDPFLADALEGFSLSDATVANEHLAVIENEISGHRQTTKVVPLQRPKTAWWKVAAIIAVIASGGVCTYSLLTKSEEKNIAQQSLPAEAANANAAQSKDSIGPADRSPVETEVPAYKTSPVVKDAALPKKPESKPANAPLQMQVNTDSEGTLLADQAAPGPALQNKRAGVAVVDSKAATYSFTVADTNVKTAKPSQFNTQHEFKGNVTDDSGQPVAGATIKINNTNTATTTDLKGNFVLKAPDTVAQVTAAAIGTGVIVAYLNSNAGNNNITLRRESQTLAEVVVGYASKRKRNQAAPDSLNAGEPVGGWKNFEQYLNRKIDSLKAGNENNYNNEDILLEFSIDNHGRPTDIRPSAEADKTMAGKAVDILSNGPRWKRNKRDKKVKVVIPF